MYRISNVSNIVGMVFSEQCCVRDEMTREEDGPLVPKLWPRLKLEGYGLRFGRSQLARLNLRLAALLHSDNLGMFYFKSIQ
jgi:hypothetical protein